MKVNSDIPKGDGMGSSASTRYLTSSILVLWLMLVWQTSGHADVRLPGFYGNHMVFQQQMTIPIWGWAEASETVKVTLGEASATTTADSGGRWRVELPPMKAGNQPLKLVVAGKNKIQIDDVLIGEVWLCSGQSNMEWTVRRSSNPEQEIAAAKYPLIRHMKAPKKPSTTPLDDIKTEWHVCSPDTVAEFTAAGYFMARELHKELGVPIGLVNSSWGGTRVEPWTPPIGFNQVEALAGIAESVSRRTPGTEENRKLIDSHLAATETWLNSARQAAKNGSPITPNPTYPSDLVPYQSHQDPTMLYNGMIHALVGFPIRGAIWYQGESNHTEGMMYFEKKKALINGWRDLWGQGKFPFYFVQIAPFQYGNEDPSTLAEFWEAQAEVLSVPNTGMIVTSDIATLNDIHPPNKQEVGRRLALLALKNDYGKSDVVAVGPTFESFEVVGEKLIVKYSNTGGGLRTRDGKSPDWFELIGQNSGGFQKADAIIVGDTVELSSEKVSQPSAMRFAWHKLAEPNLAGGTGLPCGAFRAGKVPEFINTVPGIEDYQLIYELDLAKLGSDIRYDLDKRTQAGDFDRVGYALELDSPEFGRQDLFVSMETFTNDVSKIGIPAAATKANFQASVRAMDVFSNVKGVAVGQGLESGYIEFWPNNYAASNSAKVSGASGSLYDFGDQPVDPVAGYGSMQVHHLAAKQTLFAINHWNAGNQADIGIGNSAGSTRDWTFKKNAGTYTKKRLRVYVRNKK